MKHSIQTSCSLLKAPQFVSALQLALMLPWWAVLVRVRPQL